MMPEFDAKKDAEMMTEGRPGGPPEVRRTSLRRRRCWLLLSKTPDTGRCRRIVVRGDRRHLKILAVEAFIFVYETVGHWQNQASLALIKAFKKGMQNLMLKKFCILMLKGSQNETKMDAEING